MPAPARPGNGCLEDRYLNKKGEAVGGEMRRSRFPANKTRVRSSFFHPSEL